MHRPSATTAVGATEILFGALMGLSWFSPSPTHFRSRLLAMESMPSMAEDSVLAQAFSITKVCGPFTYTVVLS